MLRLTPITLREACAFISELHRHHVPPRGWKFGIGVEQWTSSDHKLVGVATVGRPVARQIDARRAAEINRLCTDGTKNACSMLYGAARRAAFAMGYERIITYILEEEPGTSLRAAGFTFVRLTKAESWSRAARTREDKAPTCRKQLWEAVSPGRESISTTPAEK